MNSHHHYSTLSPCNSVPYGADWNDDPQSIPKRRKINVAHHGSDETNEKVPKATDSKHGSQRESGPTTPLPDKKLLVFILDRLQKKDTHGVFSEPVDPEELPDYHDIIEHPMDFATVRKKLDGERYTNLEQFEVGCSVKDVFLICSNAMQYNAADTIYYRQARAMQEMARKDFSNLRQDSDDSEPQPKIVRRGRPPGKNSRKSLGTSPSERIGPESSSDATLASGGDNASASNNYNLRKGISKLQPAESLVKASPSNLNSGGYTTWPSEWENEFPASVLKAVLRYGKKQFMVDETRRDTYYKPPVASGNEPPMLDTVEEEFKQLIAVGLNVKHSYARSLACFAADLGPVVWKIAARKIRSVLPVGHGFGPGWVGEDEVSQRQHYSVYDEERSLDSSSIPEDYSSRFPPSPSGSLPVANKSCLQGGDMILNRGLNSQSEMNSFNSVGSGIESMVPLRIQQESVVHSDNLFGSNGRLGPKFSPQMRMVKLADLTGFPSSGDGPQMIDKDSTSNLTTCMRPSNINSPVKSQISSDFGQSDSCNLLAQESGFEFQRGHTVKSSWQELAVPVKHNSLSFGKDLNGRIEATNSPSSSVDTGTQLQPNLSLQL
ncbi:Bromodomain and PHD finger-containing protein 3 [Senna tora]|uniref:Bromodomain and PHD finger-containing protein 3 n=1 Tax=Senna tora TaxID=362788 RepID=A0A834WRK8_9FABA|nr:Bromodomain and PHD finger-containing protein 3 [Senna tora]